MHGRGFISHTGAGVILVLAACAAGCASSQGPAVVTMTGGAYAAAFDSALDAVRRAGMPAELVDRRSGVVETEYRHAGTVLEPWRTDSMTFAGSFESTINHERRKARIEFTPVRFAQEPGARGQLTGPDLIGEQLAIADLTNYDGRIEVRAWVQIERSTVVGRRRGDWTRRSASMTIHPDSGLDRSQTFWTPVARDAALESRLLREIADAVAHDAGATVAETAADVEHDQAAGTP